MSGCTSRTGIKERRILKAKAWVHLIWPFRLLTGLLKKRGISAEEIDLIIFAQPHPICLSRQQQISWHTKLVLKMHGVTICRQPVPALYLALATGAQFIENGKHKKYW
jgi:3-oxoacyl-[acyl-carrier-protein] synthase-3